jgi:adenylate cyclase
MSGTRRLAAILAADVAGYSRLMAADEAGTLARLRSLRAEVIDSGISKLGGKVVGSAGDSLLIEFASAVNAVQCAVELQAALAERSAGLPEEQRMLFRMGVNLGDVIAGDGTIHGDGVNVAARLEKLAEPGGVCVGHAIHDQVRGKLPYAFADLGEQRFHNIPDPVRAYRVGMAEPSVTMPRSLLARGSPNLPDKPSIALLPFVNMSDDPGRDYLADCFTENIITGLSRFRDLFVIASNSTFAYKNKAARIQEVSRDLGVHYVLEGSVQKSGDRIRITAQLIDGENGHHLWAERYDRDADDIFAVQDEVTEMIIATLAAGYGGRLRKAWQGRIARRGPQSYQAYDYFQRGMELFNRFTREDVECARDCYRKAIELDAGLGKAYAKLAWTHLVDLSLGWAGDSEDSMARAREYANLAVSRDDEEGWGHWAWAGYYLICQRQHDRAIAAYRKAVEINPNDADVLNDFGQCLSYAGSAKDGVEMVRRAMRLNPHFPEYWLMQFGPILFDARQYADAIVTLESLRELDTVSVQLYLAASHVALDQADQARAAVLRIRAIDPQATIERCTSPEMAPYKNQSDLEHYRDRLRQAGLPD